MQDVCRDETSPPFLLEDDKAYVTFHDSRNVQYRRAAQNLAREVLGR